MLQLMEERDVLHYWGLWVQENQQHYERHFTKKNTGKNAFYIICQFKVEIQITSAREEQGAIFCG